MAKLKLSLAMAMNPRAQPVLEGAVQPDGIDLDVTVMHPGPINRGVELSSDIADGPGSVILEQVANGIAVRMAMFYLVASARSSS